MTAVGIGLFRCTERYTFNMPIPVNGMFLPTVPVSKFDPLAREQLQAIFDLKFEERAQPTGKMIGKCPSKYFNPIEMGTDQYLNGIVPDKNLTGNLFGAINPSREKVARSLYTPFT